MKREHVLRSIERSQRYLGLDSNRAVVRVSVAPPIVTREEAWSLTRAWGVRSASLEPSRDPSVQIVEFLLKTFSREDSKHHAAYLLAWFKSLRCRGARVVLLRSNGAIPMHALRSIWRARRLREQRARQSAGRT